MKEELEQFFEYEKHDTLEEFILNFEPFIEKYEDKKFVYQYLLKLFQIQKQDLINSKAETPELFLVGIRKNIRYTKNIISYLKEQLQNIPKPEMVHNQAIRENKNVPIIKKKRLKKERTHKIELSEEEQVLQKNLESEVTRKDCIQSLSDSSLTTFIHYYGRQKNNLVAFKISCRNSNQYDSLDDIQTNINFTNDLLEALISENVTRKVVTKENQKKSKNFITPISEIQLTELDTIYHTNIIAAIHKIKELEVIKSSESQKLLVQSLADLISSCSALINELEKSKNKDNYQTINIHMNILNNLKNYLKHYQRQNNLTTQKVANNSFEEEVELTEDQMSIKERLFDYDMSGYSKEDILFAFGHFIKNDDIRPMSSVLKFSKEIVQELNEQEIDTEELIQAIYYVWDSIRYRLTIEPKEHKETRRVLKDIRILFDFIIKNYKEDKKATKHDYLFDVVDYFLKSEDNYIYLKQLTKELPKIVNAKHNIRKNGEIQEEHIVVYIVKQFIRNYKKFLCSKNEHYVNIDYLKNVYLLFTRNYQLYLTEEEKNKIDQMLGTFMNEVNHSLTSSKRKNRVKEDLKVMYTDKFYMPRKLYLEKEIDEYRLENKMNSISYQMGQDINYKRMDLTEETAVTLGNGFHAYSIDKKDDLTTLKIHVIDLYNLFLPYSELDRYLFNMTLKQEKMDSMLTRMFMMKSGETYPTITYEITFDEKGNYKDEQGKMLNFNIYQSKVNVKKNYSDYHLVYAKGDIVFKSYLDLYRISMIKNHQNYNQSFCTIDVDQYFEGILNEAMIQTFQKNKFPFIYSGICDQSEEEYVRIMNHISHILTRLEKEDFNKIYQVISKNNDEYHYSLKPFKGSYDLNIMNPLNYVGISIQRFVHEFIIDNRHTIEEQRIALKKITKQYDEMIATFNYYRDYVDKDVLKANMGKLVKVKKMLF